MHAVTKVNTEKKRKGKGKKETEKERSEEQKRELEKKEQSIDNYRKQFSLQVASTVRDFLKAVI